MSTYITIDLDFFNASKLNLLDIVDDLKRKSNIKEMFLVSAHHKVLKHLNKMDDVNHVINMDYHSDICKKHKDVGLNCGTWGCFVRKDIKSKGQYSWLYPRTKCESHSEGYCWSNENENPFKENNHEWNFMYKGKFSSLPYNEIKYASLCLSPAYTDSRTFVKYAKFLLKIGVTKEQMEEFYSLLAFEESEETKFVVPNSFRI